MTDIIIAPSILSADFSRLGDEIENVMAAGSDWVHLDVMDGHFVPNLTFGPPIIKSRASAGSITCFDCHLMIEPCDPYLEAFAEAGADIITVSCRGDKASGPFPCRRSATWAKRLVSRSTRQHRKSVIEYVLDRLDLILLMTVNPGFGGQAFIEPVVDKVTRVKKMIGDRPIHIEIDGGVTPVTAPWLSMPGLTFWWQVLPFSRAARRNTTKVTSRLFAPPSPEPPCAVWSGTAERVDAQFPRVSALRPDARNPA